tara:strand:- start:12 stop:764 length:753 start_codon:yes stop_codon:yes gene_type:complete
MNLSYIDVIDIPRCRLTPAGKLSKQCPVARRLKSIQNAKDRRARIAAELGKGYMARNAISQTPEERRQSNISWNRENRRKKAEAEGRILQFKPQHHHVAHVTLYYNRIEISKKKNDAHVAVWRDTDGYIEHMRKKEANRAYHSYHNNEKYRIYHLVKKWMNKYFLEGTYGNKWPNILGYNGTELAAHLQSNFKDGMTMANHGEWHVDHIVPADAFEFTTTDCQGFKDCYELSNIQPLWAHENSAKGRKTS